MVVVVVVVVVGVLVVVVVFVIFISVIIVIIIIITVVMTIIIIDPYNHHMDFYDQSCLSVRSVVLSVWTELCPSLYSNDLNLQSRGNEKPDVA